MKGLSLDLQQNFETSIQAISLGITPQICEGRALKIDPSPMQNKPILLNILFGLKSCIFDLKNMISTHRNDFLGKNGLVCKISKF